MLLGVRPGTNGVASIVLATMERVALLLPARRDGTGALLRLHGLLELFLEQIEAIFVNDNLRMKKRGEKYPRLHKEENEDDEDKSEEDEGET